MNHGTSVGRIPANVFVNARAIVTAGFANDVDAVNQYADVMYAANSERRRRRSATHASPDDGQQSERGNELAEHLSRASPCVLREGEQRFLEHHVRRGDADKGADHLRHDHGWHFSPGNTLLPGIGERYGGIEVCT